MAVVLDTCAWLWLCTAPQKLSRAARDAVKREQQRGGLVVSIFSAWEIAKLVQKGKLTFAMPCRQWIDAAMRVEGVTVHPLTRRVDPQCGDVVAPVRCLTWDARVRHRV